MSASTRSRWVIRRWVVADAGSGLTRTRVILRAGALVVPAFALLAACSAMIGVHIGGSLEQPVARFGNDVAKPEKACVNAFSVQEVSHPRMAPVWSVQAEGGRCRRLEQVIYGQDPKGFETAVAAMPLRAGVRYYVRASGHTGGPLTRVPWMGGGDYIFEDGAWRPVDPRQLQP